MKRATNNRQATPVTSRATPSPGRASLTGRTPVALAGSLLMALALASCTGGSPAITEPSAATPTGLATTGTSQPATSAPTATQRGTAGPGSSVTAADPGIAAMKQTVTDALGRLAAGIPKPATAQVTDALTGAGIAPAALEVSASRTPTGLEADAIEAAVLQGTSCVLGQVRDGTVTVTVLPVLASGKCFVGAAS
ncbi:MAG TPA: hypothetical protein VIM40_13255 [Arthrobacter sp.]